MSSRHARAPAAQSLPTPVARLDSSVFEQAADGPKAAARRAYLLDLGVWVTWAEVSAAGGTASGSWRNSAEANAGP